MTKREAMKATDAEITRTLAEKVMKWTYGKSPGGISRWLSLDETYAVPCDDFNPLVSISDAFMVVRKMRDRHEILLWLETYSNGQFGCDALTMALQPVASVKADTPARAISLAAYQALIAIEQAQKEQPDAD